MRMALACLVLPFALATLAFGQPSRGWTHVDHRTESVSETAQPETNASPATASGMDGTQSVVRLQYVLATPWERVLRELAEGTRSELVAERMPPGRFSRRDRREYTRTEAVRLLNRELERVGFRILEQGRYLVVIALRDLRADYQRPVYRPREIGVRTQPGYAPVAQPGSVPMRQPSGVQTVGHQEPGQISPQTTPRPVPQRLATPSEPETPPIWVDSVDVSEGRAVEVARSIYLAFGTRAAIVRRGPQGLPAFDAFQTEAHQKRIFRIGIDREADRLVVEATPDRVGTVRTLVHRLDRDRAARFTPTVSDGEQTARKLRPVLQQLAFQQPGNNLAPNAQPPADVEGDGRLPLAGALQGEVNIQNVPGLGLVVTGNEADVERVLKVIQRIEALSVGTAPEIRLRPLNHVNSVALAGLLQEVFEKYTALLTESNRTGRGAAVVPLVQPNALLILAPQQVLEGVLTLVDELDQPIDPAREFAVIRLSSASATNMGALLEPFYEDRGGLGSRARIIADARTNSLVIQATPRDLTELIALVKKLDRDSTATVNQMRVVPLQNALAEELAEVLNDTFESILEPTDGGATGNAANANVRSTVLHLLTDPNDPQKRVRSGLLLDVRITADPRSNALLVTAPVRTMELMVRLIESLDRPATAVAEIKVFQLRSADAATVVELLGELFETDADEGVQFAGGDGASGTLVPLKFSTDPRTNSVVAVGSARALEVVEAIILRLDGEDGRQRDTHVYKLKNAPALDVAAAVNQFLDSQRSINEADPALSTPFEQIEREVVVVPELVSNSLIISGSPKYFEEIQRIIYQLDEAPPQVTIQALLVEVVLENVDELGVELGIQDSILFDRGTIEILETLTTTNTAPNGVQTTTTDVVSQTANPGFNFNNLPLGNNTAAQATDRLGGQGLSNFGVGRVNSELGFGGLVLSASSENISILLRALSQNREVNILSRPQIRTLDNQLAQIQVGQQVPIVNGVNVTTLGVANPLIIQDEAGIILSVTPRINSDGIIVMEVAAEKSQFTGNGVPIFTQTDGSVITSPIKDVTTARATVSVPNNQTIVLGGMITESTEDLTRKVPFLGDIPLVGQLFRYDGHDSRRTELLIFLTPRIVRNDADSEDIKLVESERLHYDEAHAESVHGPLFGVPEPGHQLPECYPAPMVPGTEWELNAPGVPMAPAPLATPGGMLSPNAVPPREFVPQETIIDAPDGRYLPRPVPPAPITPIESTPR